jgi:hypothetical protein
MKPKNTSNAESSQWQRQSSEILNNAYTISNNFYLCFFLKWQFLLVQFLYDPTLKSKTLLKMSLLRFLFFKDFDDAFNPCRQ